MTTSEPRAAGRLVVLMLVAVLAWGAFLRFDGITRSRLLLCDEAFYLMEARRIVGQARACALIYRIFKRDRPAGLIKLGAEDRSEVERLAGDGYGQLGGRFGHDLLLACGLGAGLPEEWGGQWIAAVFGTGTLMLIAAFCAARYGPRVAVFATVCLAGSVLHLSYSRSTLCESDCVFFIVAALLGYASHVGGGAAAWLVAAGISFGAAFVCNVRALPVAYGLVVFEISMFDVRASTRRLAVFAACAAVPLVCAEALYHVVFLFSGATGVVLTRQTYVHTLIWQFFRLNGGVLGAGTNLGLYPRYLVSVENPLLLGVYVAGLGYLLCLATRARPVERLLSVVAVFCALYWEVAVGIKCLRYLAPLIPIASIAAGLAFARALRRWDDSPVIACLVAGLLVAAGTASWWPWRGETTGYREAASWLATQGQPRMVATQASYFRLFFPPADVEVATDLAGLRALHARGFRWYVDCYQKYYWSNSQDLLALQRELKKRGAPRTFAQPMAATPFAWFEGGHVDVPAEWIEDAGTIKVWDLDLVFRASP